MSLGQTFFPTLAGLISSLEVQRGGMTQWYLQGTSWGGNLNITFCFFILPYKCPSIVLTLETSTGLELGVCTDTMNEKQQAFVSYLYVTPHTLRSHSQLQLAAMFHLFQHSNIGLNPMVNWLSPTPLPCCRLPVHPHAIPVDPLAPRAAFQGSHQIAGEGEHIPPAFH